MQLKKIAFLRRRPSLSLEEFQDYWKTVHGPLVANTPGYHDHRRRYVQNHPRRHGPLGEEFDWNGIAEFWIPTQEPNEDMFSQLPLYKDRIQVDERNFIDMGATVSLTAQEHVVRPGRGDTKIVVLSSMKNHPGVDHRSNENLDEYLDFLMHSAPNEINGISVDIAIPGTFRLPGGRPVQPIDFHWIETFRVESPARAEKVYSWLANNVNFTRHREALHVEARQSLLVEEFVFFDNGKPTVESVD